MNETPNLYFSGEDFTTFLMFAKSMSNSKGSRIALLHVENGKLVCKSVDSNRSNYIEYSAELYNDDNIIEEPIAISINDLTALVKCANSNRFAIRKNISQYEFNIIGGGWLPFKTVEVNLSNYDFNGEATEIGKVSSTKFRNAISSVLSYTQDYNYARDKYIQFSKDQMTVTSRRSGVVTTGEFADITLHRDDAAMLKTLLKNEFELVISSVTSEAERILFTGHKFKYAIMAAEVDSANIKYRTDLTDYIKVSCDDLYKICVFAEEYSSSKHILDLSIKYGLFRVSVKNVLAAKHVSTLQTKRVGDVQDTSQSIEVASGVLLKTLKMFQEKRADEVNIYITDNCSLECGYIIVFDETTQAIIDVCNR